MYELFTKDARAVMSLANEEAQRRYHEYVGTEHVLYAILKMDTCNACIVLKQLTNTDDTRSELDKIIINGPDMITIGKVPSTPRTRKVIELAMQWGRKRSTTLFDTDDLLLGLIEENDGVAAQVLMNRGVTVGAVRNTLKKLGIRFQDNPPEKELRSSVAEQGAGTLQEELALLKQLIGAPSISDAETIWRARLFIRYIKATDRILKGEI